MQVSAVPGLGDRGRLMTLIAVGGTHAASWFAPTLEDTPGWQAFRIVLSPIWPYGGFGGPTFGLETVIHIASGLTNVVFAAVFGLVVMQPAFQARLLFSLVAACTVLNLYWFGTALYGGEVGGLRIGYYLWIASFAGLSAMIHLRLSFKHSWSPP